MMLPDIPYKTRTKKVMQTQFGGLDRRKAAGNGTICAMQQMTSDDYPMISTRALRHYIPEPDYGEDTPAPWETVAHGVFSDGEDVYAFIGSTLYVNGEKAMIGPEPADSSTIFTATDKSWAALGKRIVIWPDKKIVTKNADGQSFAVTDLGTSVSLTGATIGNGTYADVQAELNTITFPSGTDLSAFREGDGVTLVGTSHNDMTAVIRELDGLQMRFYANTFSEAETISSVDAKAERLVPDLDYICSNGNRVWGCKDDTIWCCKLGDPRNWYVFDGISTDSWTVDTGTAGAFTGCISFGGYPVFFKQDRIFRLYGNRATNFEAVGSEGPGVRIGAARSLAVVGSALYYLSADGFMQYTGGYPQKIDDALNARYKTAVGGGDRLKYYVSTKALDETFTELLVYDPRRRIWCKEDNLSAEQMAYCRGLYAQEGHGKLTILGVPDDVPASAETEVLLVGGQIEFGDWDYSSFDSKYPTKLWLRIEGSAMAAGFVDVSYDGGDFQRVGQFAAGGQKRSFYLPMPISRCDHFRLRITGSDQWTLRAIEQELYAGPESRIP